MNQVTILLGAIEQGDPEAADRLLPLVYEELRKLAAQRMKHEKPGQTLHPTAIVHAAFLRLFGKDGVNDEGENACVSRGHFFGSASEAMRRVLVDSARRKKRTKPGGVRHRVHLEDQPAEGDRADD